MTHQPELIPDQPAPDQAARDAERAEYLDRLREYLHDPDFRAIEGFPHGSDEDILALSDPPYYTACPNPFLPEIIERWREEREEIRRELGLDRRASSVIRHSSSAISRMTDDESRMTPDASRMTPDAYHREPFAADVSEGKYSSIYRAHTYHTKVPHKAIMRYILHYTDPGDIVFDGFCGTGMTGVAAQLCADRKTVQELGYRVDEDGVIYDGDEAVSHLGARKAVLVDLSPAATFIAYNYNTPVDADAFEREAKRITNEVEEELGWMYQTWHPDCDDPDKVKGRIRYVIWSDVFICPQCGEEVVLWNAAVDKEKGQVLKQFSCPGCGADQSKRNLERAWKTVYDSVLGQTVRQARQIPVSVKYSVNGKWHKKAPDSADLALVQHIQEQEIPY